MIIIKILTIYLLIGLLYLILMMAWIVKNKVFDNFKEYKSFAFLLLIESIFWPITICQIVKVLIMKKF